jgi:hypothetical protein
LNIFWPSFFGFLEKLGLLVVPLIAAYVGWRLSQKSFARQLLVDSLKNKFDALRELKSIIGNIPPDLNEKAIVEKMRNNKEFRESLTGRMVRLLGLRNELIPFIAPEFVELIDSQLEPLYTIENGCYDFKLEKMQEFGVFAERAKRLVSSIEIKLSAEYKEQLK